MSFLPQPSRRRKQLLVALLLTAIAIVFAGCKSSAIMAPAGDFLYYAGGTGGAINKVSTGEIAITSFKLTNGQPSVGLLSPDGSRGYVVDGGTPSAVITTVRTSDLHELAHATLSAGSITTGVISPDGAYGYFGNEAGTVTVVNLTTLAQVASVATGNDALLIHTATISPDGAYAYFGTSSQTVVKVDLHTLTVVATATLADYGTYIANAVISPDGQYGYYTVGATPAKFVKVRLADMTPRDSITTSVNVADSTIISPDGKYAYIGTDDTPMRLVTIRLTGLTEVRTQTLTISGSEGWAVMSPDGQFAYVGNSAGEIQKTRVVPISNVFTMKAPKHSSTNSSIAITTVLRVPGPGTIRTSATRVVRSGKTLCSMKAQVKHKGTYTLTCLIGQHVRTALASGALRLTLATTFAPTGGESKTTQRTLVLPRTPLTDTTSVAPVTG